MRIETVDTVVLFEDAGYRQLLPLVYTRPVYQLRCGIYTLQERVAALLGQAPAALCRPHLATVAGSGRWPLGLLGRSAPLTLINGRALTLDWLPELLNGPIDSVVREAESGSLLGARLSPRLASAILGDLLRQDAAATLAELARFATLREQPAAMITQLWDLIVANGTQIGHDVAITRAVGEWPSAAEQPLTAAGVTLRCPEQIFVHPDARLEGPLVLDARDGPILIDAARIEPFSYIQGPCAIGPGALVASARVRGETTIGPVCRVGGEVEASILQGYSNKHHDGFLGHAYLGEWVNIGAMTTNSDLKNTYGTIRVGVEGHGQVDSGVLKLGCFLADHVKLGIGLHLSGGAVIGTGANLFGVPNAPKTVPPFTWGGEVFREYRIDGMIEVARKVMARRRVALSADQETMLRDVFAMTRGERVALDPLVTPVPPFSTPALAQAEREAVQAFEPSEALI